MIYIISWYHSIISKPNQIFLQSCDIPEVYEYERCVIFISAIYIFIANCNINFGGLIFSFKYPLDNVCTYIVHSTHRTIAFYVFVFYDSELQIAIALRISSKRTMYSFTMFKHHIIFARSLEVISISKSPDSNCLMACQYFTTIIAKLLPTNGDDILK